MLLFDFGDIVETVVAFLIQCFLLMFRTGHGLFLQMMITACSYESLIILFTIIASSIRFIQA